MLVVLERQCLELREEIGHLTEKQEVLAILMEGKMNMQKVAPEKHQEKIFEESMELEEQKTREALELVQGKHKLVKWESERERARMLQGMELSGAVGHCSGGLDNSSFGSCSSSLALDTDEAMSASSKMAQDADDAMSESSWAALATGKERGWWSIDLDGEIEKLEVVGLLSGTEGGSVEPKRKSRKRLKWKWRMTWPCAAWDYFILKRAWAGKILADGAQQKQEGKQGQWQQESSFKEVLEQARRSADTDCSAQTMLHTHITMKHGT